MNNMKSAEYHFGTGRRKSAVAQVRIAPGSGKISNVKKADYKLSAKDEAAIKEPLILLSQENKFDISYIVNGGGVSSQIDAIKLGLARALSKSGDEIEKTLKKSSFLSRDPREKERKKPGLKRARRAPQWAKR
jgi:small subunit ribosomal protein S9